jgi:hypothetical protein
MNDIDNPMKQGRIQGGARGAEASLGQKMFGEE